MKVTPGGDGARRGSWTAQGTARWQAWDAGYFARTVGFSCLVGLLFLRFAEWKGGFASFFFPLDRLALDPSWRPLLAALLVANAVVLDRSLAGRVPGIRVPLALRVLLGVLAALPIVGVLAWPAWQRLALPASEGMPARLDLGDAGFGSPLLRFDRLLVRGRERMGALIAWLVLGQLTPFMAILVWLAAPAPAGAIGTVAAPVGRALLSLAGFASAWIYALGAERRAARPLHRVLAGALPFVFLLPGALPLLGIPLWLPVAREIREEATFVHAVYDRRHRTSPPPLEPNRIGRRRMLLAALAVGLLPFESALFGAWIEKAGWAKHVGPPLAFVIAMYGIGALAFPAFRVARAAPAHRRAALANAVPRAALLVAAPLLATAGLYSGIFWAEGNRIGVNQMAILVALLAPTSLTLTALTDYALRLPDPEGGGLRAGPLQVGILAALALPAGVAWIAKERPFLLPLLPLLALAARGVLVASLGRRSLRPGRTADLADPRLPWRTRLALAGLVVATAAPLGGLVLPALSLLPPNWRTELDRRLFRARLARNTPEASPRDEAQERARGIARRRKSTRHDLRGGGPWRHFDLDFSAGISSMVLLGGLLVGESQLWPHGFSPVSFSPRLAQTLGIASLAFLPIQAWLMDQYLSAKTPFPKALPARWTAVRRLVAAVPGLGLVLIPAWRRFVERNASPPPPLALDASPRSRTAESAAESSMRYGSVGLVTAASFLPLCGLSIWIAVRAPLGVSFVAFSILHLVASFLLRRELAQKVAEEPGNSGARRQRGLFPWIALLPMPLGFLPWVARIFLPAERRTETLVWSVYVQRQSAANTPFADSPAARRAAPALEGLAAAGNLSLLRWKSLLVAFDVLVVSGAVSRFASRGALGDGFRLRSWSGLSLLTFGRLDLTVLALAAAAAGLALLVFTRLAGLGGRDNALERQGIRDAARTLFLTQAAAAFGLLLAPFADSDQMREFLTLAVLGLACVAIGGVFLLMPGSAAFRRPSGLRHMRWLFLYLGLLATLTLFARPLTRPGTGPTLLIAFAGVLPFLHFLLYRTHAASFLRPWRRGSLGDRGLPWPIRLSGGFLEATALLPLGGLFLPVAIVLRAKLGASWRRSLRASSVHGA